MARITRTHIEREAPTIAAAIKRHEAALTRLYAQRLRYWKVGDAFGMKHRVLGRLFGKAQSTVTVALKRERDR